MKLLYINSCVRRESRTNQIAKALIAKIAKQTDVEKVALASAQLQPLSEERLNQRTGRGDPRQILQKHSQISRVSF